jgi:aryl-phospho-beta-D-glucosidase BglC (GH1 family)
VIVSEATTGITNEVLSGTAEANSTVTIYYDGTTVLGTTAANSSGAWNFTGSLAVGTHTLTATDLDAAGNTSQASSAVNVTIIAPATTASVANPIAPGTIGVNVDGAEYTWSYYPSVSNLNYLQSEGVTLLRLPISWENFQPTLNGPLNQTQVADLEGFLADAAAHGMQVIIDLHNFGRYNTVSDPASATADIGAVIGSAALPVSDFANFWSQLATQLLGQPAIAGYDIMNEPNNMGSPSVWPAAAQAAVNAIRAVDMNTTIYVEGTGWASAENWLNYNANLHIVDPANNLVYEAHQYFDANQSGTYTQTYAQQGANPNTGVADIQPFLQWLQQNNAKGFIGESGVPNSDPNWIPVLNNFLNALKAAGISGTEWYYDGNPLDQPGNSLGLAPDPGIQRPQWAALFAHTAPAIIAVSSDSGAITNGVTNASVVTMTGTGAANSTVTVFDGTTQIGTMTASANGSWSFTTGTLANGAHSFTAADEDSLGNISAASAALAVTVDTVAAADGTTQLGTSTLQSNKATSQSAPR